MNEFLWSILKGINSVVNNYGWSIIIFTLLIRLVILPFDAKSRKSMRKMSKVQPQLNALQTKYAKDKEKLNQKTMELYKKEKINPMSSCLPMLLTMPILFAMFAAMRMIANTELATQLLTFVSGGEVHFEQFLWIKNLWMADSPFAPMVPDVASINLIPLDIWQQAFATFQATGALLPELLNAAGEIVQPNFATNEAMKATVDALVLQMQAMPAYEAAIAGVPGWTNVNVVLFNFTVFIQHNGLFILPLVAAGSQLLMTKVNPQATGAQPTPQQNGQAAPNTGAFMKWFFPLFSLFICAGQNAGFSLYWVMANIIATLQTIILNKYFDAKEKNEGMVGEGTVK